MDHTFAEGAKRHPILLIQNQPEDWAVVLKRFANQPFDIEIATSDMEALRKLGQKNFALIIQDLAMSNSEGFELTKQIHSYPRSQETPLMLVLEDDNPADIIHGFRLGAAECIVPPFSTDHFIKRTIELMDHGNAIVALKRELESLHRINRERKDLLQVLCHDLMNSVGGSLAFVQYTKQEMRRGELQTSDLIGNLTSVEISLQKAYNTIQRVREIRTIEEGRFPISLQSLSLLNGVMEAIRLLEAKAQAKKISFDFAIPPTLTVLVDRDSFIEIILHGILLNAIKYSERGSTVGIRAISEGKYVYIKIEDSGIGIPPEMLRNLSRIDKSLSRPGTEGEGGTGFTLILIQQLLLLYGGGIQISSVSDEESRVSRKGTTVALHVLQPED